MLTDKHIVLGVTGGIAAYKAADIVSLLKKKGAVVHVIMTKNAAEIITPLTLATMSKNRVITDMFDTGFEYEVEHISLAQQAEVFLIAPATANIIGKIASGIADDMLSTTVMATKAPVILAPAMNTNMYDNPIVQDNIKKLKQFGYAFVEPKVGMLACGVMGKGHLADVETIVEAVVEHTRSH